MCQLTELQVFLGTAGALVLAAVIAIGVAAALNNGFFSAAGAPAAMIVAGGCTLGAVGALAAARIYAEKYFQCMGSPAACAGAYSNLRNALTALITVLTFQATACFVAAGIAWIPWAGQAPMWVILGSLVIQMPLIASLIAFGVQLVDCANKAATRTAASVLSLTVSVLMGAIATVFVALISRRAEGAKGMASHL